MKKRIVLSLGIALCLFAFSMRPAEAGTFLCQINPWNPCPSPTASPCPSGACPTAQPSPSPTSAPNPTSTPRPTASPRPSSSPRPSASPYSQRTTLVDATTVTCENRNFEVVATLKQEGNTRQGVEVEFEYAGQKILRTTGPEGKAQVSFTSAGSTETVYVRPRDGFPTMSQRISVPNCTGQGGQVLGATTDSTPSPSPRPTTMPWPSATPTSEVMGATSYAQTGGDLVTALLTGAGLLTSAGGGYVFWKRRNK